VTASGCDASLCTLYRDNATVSNPDNQILDYGVHYYKYATDGNATYNPASAWYSITININPTPAPDPFTTIFSNNYTLLIIASIMFSSTVIFVGAARKIKKIPMELFILNFVMFLGFFIQVVGGTNTDILIIMILGVAGLGTFLANKMFLGTHGEDKIFLSYLIFFGLAFFFINFTALSTNLFIGSVPSPTTQKCDVTWLNILTVGLICAFNMLYTIISPIFSFGSSLGIINIILVTPFGYFIGKYIIDWLRGRGGG
jgi:hypothetical protein